MRPLEQDLAVLRGERDLLLTELRRRRRLAERTTRADLKTSMREGELPSIAEIVASSEAGSLDDYVYNLKTGGQVRLGFPGARSQSLTFTDGVNIANAADLAAAARLYAAGWELGSPGRPGVRVHFPGTRQERLVPADEVYARPREPAADAYAQSFFASLPSIQGLDSATFAGDTLITDSTGKVVLADVGNHGDHRLAVKLKDVSPVAVQATVAIEDKGFYTNPGIDFQ